MIRSGDTSLSTVHSDRDHHHRLGHGHEGHAQVEGSNGGGGGRDEEGGRRSRKCILERAVSTEASSFGNSAYFNKNVELCQSEERPQLSILVKTTKHNSLKSLQN